MGVSVRPGRLFLPFLLPQALARRKCPLPAPNREKTERTSLGAYSQQHTIGGPIALLQEGAQGVPQKGGLHVSTRLGVWSEEVATRGM